jgi:hypothetical protein
MDVAAGKGCGDRGGWLSRHGGGHFRWQLRLNDDRHHCCVLMMVII